MKAKLGGKSFEIDENRVRGGVVGTRTYKARQIGVSRSLDATSSQGRHQEALKSTTGSNPAPAPHSPPLSLCFTLWGQIPSGKNAVLITRTGHRYPAKRFVKWRTEAMRQLPPVAGPFLGPLHLIVDYVKGDLRRRDLPGMTDAILHLIEKAGYVLDDAQVVQQTWTPFPIDRKHPRCTITLSPLTLNLDEEVDPW